MKKNSFQPIFVVGNSRSGTTLMAKILRGSRDIHVFSELHYFERLWDSSDNGELDSHAARELYAKLKQTMHEGLFSTKSWQSYLRGEGDSSILHRLDDKIGGFDVYRIALTIETDRYGKKRPCEQTPRYVFFLHELMREFTDARVLVMTRDPRAVLLSQKKKWRRKNIEHSNKSYPLFERIRSWANYQPLVTSALWSASIKAGQKFESDPRVKHVRFEDLLSQSKQTVNDICSFLGIEYEDSMLDVASSLSPTAGQLPHRSVDKGIDPFVAEQWKKGLGSSDIYWCERINGKYMHQLGYPITGVPPVRTKLLVDLISLPFKSGLAVFLNIGKISNIYKAFRRRFG